MTESEQFRLTRWAIPGWVAILSFAAFVASDVLFTPAPGSLFASATEIVRTASAMSAAVAALLAVAAGVPLGFLIYQAYFYLRWNSPFSREGLLPPFIVGRNEDLDRTVRDLSPEDLHSGTDWKRRWIEHPLTALDHGWRWRYIENLFTEAAQKVDAAFPIDSIFSRHRTLLDLMHTLGASLAGLYIGFGSYLVYKAKVQTTSFTADFALAAVPLTILIILLDLEDKARKQIEGDYSHPPEVKHPPSVPLTPAIRIRRREAQLRVGQPAAIWLIFLWLMIYLSAPSPFHTDTLSPSPLRNLVAIAPILAWALARLRPSRSIWAGETVVLLASFFLAKPAAGAVSAMIPNMDWAYMGSVLIFLVGNTVFLRNRQNVRDDLISLEYYTLRRFISDRDHLSAGTVPAPPNNSMEPTRPAAA